MLSASDDSPSYDGRLATETRTNPSSADPDDVDQKLHTAQSTRDLATSHDVTHGRKKPGKWFIEGSTVNEFV